MKIEQSVGGKIKITLNDDDMKKYDITFAGLDYNHMDTKRVVWELLSKARSETGFDFSRGSLLVEAFESPGGGCTLYFTNVCSAGNNGSTKRMKFCRNCFGPYIFEFDSCSEMMDCMTHLDSMHSGHIVKSHLYVDGEKYYLAIFTSTKPDKVIVNTLLEYSRQIKGGKSLAYLDEHCKLLSSPDAISAVARG